MSQRAEPLPLPSTGRGRLRWSTVGQIVPSPESIAELAAVKPWVRVGLPLLASGPTLTFAAGVFGQLSPLLGKPQVPSSSRLWPRLISVGRVPAQSPPD